MEKISRGLAAHKPGLANHMLPILIAGIFSIGEWSQERREEKPEQEIERKRPAVSHVVFAHSIPRKNRLPFFYQFILPLFISFAFSDTWQ